MTSAQPTLKAIIAVITAIMCGTLVAISVHMSLLWTFHEQTARLSQVTATVIAPAAPEQSQPAIGRWTTPDGTQRTGIIPAPPSHTTGMSHPVWINKAGQVTTPPKSPLHRGAQTVLAGAAVTTAITLITRRSAHLDNRANCSARTPRCGCTSSRGGRGPQT